MSIVEKLNACEPGDWIIVRSQYVGCGWRREVDGLTAHGLGAARVKNLTPQKVRLMSEVGYKSIYNKSDVVGVPGTEAEARRMIAAIRDVQDREKLVREPLKEQLSASAEREKAGIAAALA